MPLFSCERDGRCLKIEFENFCPKRNEKAGGYKQSHIDQLWLMTFPIIGSAVNAGKLWAGNAESKASGKLLQMLVISRASSYVTCIT
jgi:hypothetical protein